MAVMETVLQSFREFPRLFPRSNSLLGLILRVEPPACATIEAQEAGDALLVGQMGETPVIGSRGNQERKSIFRPRHHQPK